MANVFTDTVVPQHGLKKGDFQEVRMDVNNMVAALAAKTVDVMVNVEPYNSIAEADGIATPIMDFWNVDRMPVLMAATPEFVAKNPDTVVAYLKAWQDVARDFKDSPGKVADAIHAFYTSKGYTRAARHAGQGAGAGRGQSGLAGRPRALPAGAGRHPATAKDHLCHSGLEKGAAAGFVGQGERVAYASPMPAPRLSLRRQGPIRRALSNRLRRMGPGSSAGTDPKTMRNARRQISGDGRKDLPTPISSGAETR